jgi:DNA-binding IclR family transcriptional regulator
MRDSINLGEGSQGLKLNQSVRKAIAILRAAASQPGGDTASGLARRAELPWTTAVRLIRTLEHERFLLRLPDGDRYVPGFDLIWLANNGSASRALTAIATGPLERLVEQVAESVNLTVVLPGGQLDVVAQIDPPRLMRSANYIGRWYPEHASSIGKLFLAHYEDERLVKVLRLPLERYASATIVDLDDLTAELARVRRNGYSTAVDELEEGLAALSVGVAGPDGDLVAIVSASGPSSRFDEGKRNKALPLVREAVAAIEQALAGEEPGAPAQPR